MLFGGIIIVVLFKKGTMMRDLKSVIAKNISELRIRDNMTQSELAEKLNYSDKAVSKWERGESLPDISVLTEISEIFCVTLDSLVHSEAADMTDKSETSSAKRTKNHIIITLISVLAVLLIATWIFSVADISPFRGKIHWLVFVYAVPVSMVVWLVFNSIWFNVKRNYLIISLLMWSALISVYLTLLLTLKINYWQIFCVGIPAQAIISAWSNLNYKYKLPKRKTRKRQHKDTAVQKKEE